MVGAWLSASVRMTAQRRTALLKLLRTVLRQAQDGTRLGMGDASVPLRTYVPLPSRRMFGTPGVQVPLPSRRMLGT